MNLRGVANSIMRVVNPNATGDRLGIDFSAAAGSSSAISITVCLAPQ